MHILKLEQTTYISELSNILAAIKNKCYSIGITEIDVFINHNKSIVPFVNKETEALKIEAKFLETEVNRLSDEKADIEKTIHTFGLRHNQELGEIILKILNFRKAKSKRTPREKEAENDFVNFSKEFENSKKDNVSSLTREQQAELKKLYRKATKLCHPDVVNDRQKELADKIFAELIQAYQENNLE